MHILRSIKSDRNRACPLIDNLSLATVLLLFRWQRSILIPPALSDSDLHSGKQPVMHSQILSCAA